MSLLTIPISPLQLAYGEIEREMQIIGINIVDSSQQLFLTQKIVYSYNSEDVSQDFKPTTQPIEINNSKNVYQRDLETFEKIPNPDYIDAETTPDVEQYLTASAYDYVVGILCENPQYFWQVLRECVLELS